MTQTLEIVDASDRSLLVRLGNAIGRTENRRVTALLHSLEAKRIPGVVNLHPAYCSILVVYDPLTASRRTLVDSITQRVRRTVAEEDVITRRTVEIPVVYDGADLADVAERHGLTPAQAAELHASALYDVQFLGFLPGFAYLSGLPEQLATPRLDTPRPLVPAGSVAIGGMQTAVYPAATPGGWRLIGRTTAALFRLDRPGYSLLETGDSVRFVPVCA